VDRAYIASVRTYFEELVAALAKLKAGGVSVEEAVGHPTLPRGYWGDEAQEPPAFRYSVARLYASIENR